MGPVLAIHFEPANCAINKQKIFSNLESSHPPLMQMKNRLKKRNLLG